MKRYYISIALMTVVAIVLTQQAKAACIEDLELIAGTRSFHALESDEGIDYNNNHKSIGIRCNKYSFGYTSNSFNQDSAFASFSFLNKKHKHFRTGYTIGMVIGYRNYRYINEEGFNRALKMSPVKVLVQKTYSTNFRRYNIDLGLGPVSTIAARINLR